MHTRIWEDNNAMRIVSVLGYLLNDEGNVIGQERTRILCKLMPSIHTITHRASIGMLIAGLQDQDAQIFYTCRGLTVLYAWIQELITRQEKNQSDDETRRLELQSQVHALLRILDVSVQTDAICKQNAFIYPIIPKLIEIFEKSGSEYISEWSRLNEYRIKLEYFWGKIKSSATQSLSVTSSVVETQKLDVQASSTPIHNERTDSLCAGDKAPSAKIVSGTTHATLSSTAGPPQQSRNATSILTYQPKSFLQIQGPNGNKEQNRQYFPPSDEDNEEDDGENTDDMVITNVSQSTISASLDQKFRNHGHLMSYEERNRCQLCRRMNAKRCMRCGYCTKCSQRELCPNANNSEISQPSENLSVKDRNQQVLGSAMDQAIYRAFKQEDFHSVFSLIQNDMDVNFQRIESDHSTALMAAAHHGREDAAQKLLSLGANPCLTDKNGHEAWVFADRKGYKSLTALLKDKVAEWKRNHSQP
uniref:Uncharacterized protein AlNc14C168G7930 n=1 Tax=Albugo laibachii Nc14 TaxID=890382 RepID=F0WN98_9STRA|nr:conserved hypothetical protein [Albugo laibachii Nc14]|eukprot:CCA22787.1 conserved hypothetical protein [Albugo laibachii Nc14]